MILSPIRSRFYFCTSSLPPSITSKAKYGSIRKNEPYWAMTLTPFTNLLVWLGKSEKVRLTAPWGLW